MSGSVSGVTGINDGEARGNGAGMGIILGESLGDGGRGIEQGC